MFDSHRKSTGIQYTTTAALFIMALLFSPAVLVVSRPFSFVSVSLAFACSASCLAFAWINWKKYSQLTVPSLETPYPRSK